jgi:hypothetical protein
MSVSYGCGEVAGTYLSATEIPPPAACARRLLHGENIMKIDYKEIETRAQLAEHAPEPVRTNTEIAAVVNRGLAAAFLVNLEAGIALMRSGGVPAHVVKRVLRNPLERRATDWKH